MSEQEDIVEISINTDDDHDDHADEENEKDSKKNKKRLSTRKLHHQLDEQEKQIETLESERDEFKDKYLRNLAEIDNFRKRVKKEKEEYQKYVLSEFLLELLQVYDNLDRALKAKTPSEKKENSVLNLLKEDDEKSIVSGVEMIFKQFSDLLKKYQVIEIQAHGKPFDPNLHQALSKEESEDVDAPMVTEVYQKGFLYNGKLLKPTLVKVVIPLKIQPPPEPETTVESEPEADSQPEPKSEIQ